MTPKTPVKNRIAPLILISIPILMLGAFVVNVNLRHTSISERGPASDEKDWSINTFYKSKDDPKTVTINGKELPMENYYGAPIFIEQTESGFQARYFGPLYAQCTGARCDPQGYKIELDTCGVLSRFIESGLKRYHPGLNHKSEHSLLSPEVLDRLKFYVNEPEVLGAIYEDIAGKDRKSNYVLGNSVPHDPSPEALKRLSSEAAESQYAHLGSTRWAMSPWATNTVATFFIHLDLIRKSVASRRTEVEKNLCPQWPEFLGRTPIPKILDEIATMHVIDRIESEAKREDRRAQMRLDNYELEAIINRVAASSAPDLVLQYAPGKGNDGELKDLLNLKNQTGQRLKLAENLKAIYLKAWDDKKLTAVEKAEIFAAFSTVQAKDLDLTYDRLGDAESFTTNVARTYADDTSSEANAAEVEEARKQTKANHERLQREWQDLNQPPRIP